MGTGVYFVYFCHGCFNFCLVCQLFLVSSFALHCISKYARYLSSLSPLVLLQVAISVLLVRVVVEVVVRVLSFYLGIVH